VTEEFAEAVRKARQEYDAAMTVIQRSASSGCPGKAGGGQEARLGQAYHKLVQLGVAPRLRGKYKG
jgi:hypothetical protein